MLLAGAVLIATAAVYWPVYSAGFVWVDKICFYDHAWLREGDAWRQLIFRGFYDWTNYFRPLVVALFVAEVRAFDTAPGPMHLVSLTLHLANTLLVGLLARGLLRAGGLDKHASPLATLSMLLYGLHPALIEPVAWVSSQFELVVNLFILLGLLANLSIQRRLFRAATVALCFFLAACAKESAVVLPLLLLVFDWATHQGSPPRVLHAIWRRQWPVYLAALVAGLVYLALRHWALGGLVHGGSESMPLLTRLQMVCFVFVTYWRILVWPMIGLAPLHFVDTRRFGVINGENLCIDLIAFVIVAGGAYGIFKRRTWATAIVAASVALLPVLHLLPIGFDSSLYHERYSMTAVAMLCTWLPSATTRAWLASAWLRRARIAIALFVLFWLGMAIANIRITLPLWSDDVRMWQWALQRNPGSALVQSHLLAAYVQAGDMHRARAVANLLMRENSACRDCMLNVAAFAVQTSDQDLLQKSLQRAQATLRPPVNTRVMLAYVIATGQLHEMRGELQAAADAYQDAIRLDRLDPMPRMDMALLLLRSGDADNARKFMDQALNLFPAAERAMREQQFENMRNGKPTAPGQP